MQPFLLQLAGISGTGKSSLARVLADRTGAEVFDYDVIKSAALDAGAAWELAGAVGYQTSHALARAALARGRCVILDSPCRFRNLLEAGTAIAQEYGASYVFLECTLDTPRPHGVAWTCLFHWRGASRKRSPTSRSVATASGSALSERDPEVYPEPRQVPSFRGLKHYWLRAS